MILAGTARGRHCVQMERHAPCVRDCQACEVGLVHLGLGSAAPWGRRPPDLSRCHKFISLAAAMILTCDINQTDTVRRRAVEGHKRVGGLAAA